jgi:hypothetical protein
MLVPVSSKAKEWSVRKDTKRVEYIVEVGGGIKIALYTNLILVIQAAAPCSQCGRPPD